MIVTFIRHTALAGALIIPYPFQLKAILGNSSRLVLPISAQGCFG
jgi:hypothetical protein